MIAVIAHRGGAVRLPALQLLLHRRAAAAHGRRAGPRSSISRSRHGRPARSAASRCGGARRHPRRQQGQLLIGLAASVLLGIAFVALEGTNGAARTSPSRRTLTGRSTSPSPASTSTHVLVGVVMLVMLFVWTLLGYFGVRRHSTVAIALMYWHFVTAVWVAVFPTFYVSPYLADERHRAASAPRRQPPPVAASRARRSMDDLVRDTRCAVSLELARADQHDAGRAMVATRTTCRLPRRCGQQLGYPWLLRYELVAICVCVCRQRRGLAELASHARREARRLSITWSKRRRADAFHGSRRHNHERAVLFAVFVATA